MDIQTEKQQICDAIMQRDEEWLITAIKKLLDLDDTAESFSEAHHTILDARLQSWKNKTSNTITLEALEKEWKASDKL